MTTRECPWKCDPFPGSFERPDSFFLHFTHLFIFDRLRPPCKTQTDRGSKGTGGGLPEGTLHDGGFIPRVCFRCPLSPGHGQLRVLLPRRYPEDPLVATVEGTPQLSALTREAISVAAQAEAQRLSGEARLEPHCLQVLGEALRVSAEHADATTGTAAAPKTASVETRKYGSGRDCSLVSEDSSTTRRLRGKLGDHPSKEGHPLEIHRYRGAGGHLEDEAHGGRESTAVVLLGRRLIYSHHIIAPQKRTGIMRAARELDLGGFSKVKGSVEAGPRA